MTNATVTVALAENGDRVIHLDGPDGFLSVQVSEEVERLRHVEQLPNVLPRPRADTTASRRCEI